MQAYPSACTFQVSGLKRDEDLLAPAIICALSCVSIELRLQL